MVRPCSPTAHNHGILVSSLPIPEKQPYDDIQPEIKDPPSHSDSVYLQPAGPAGK